MHKHEVLHSYWGTSNAVLLKGVIKVVIPFKHLGTNCFVESLIPMLLTTNHSSSSKNNYFFLQYFWSLSIVPDVPEVSLTVVIYLWFQMMLVGLRRCSRGSRMVILSQLSRGVLSPSKTYLSFHEAKFLFLRPGSLLVCFT